MQPNLTPTPTPILLLSSVSNKNSVGWVHNVSFFLSTNTPVSMCTCMNICLFNASNLHGIIHPVHYYLIHVISLHLVVQYSQLKTEPNCQTHEKETPIKSSFKLLCFCKKAKRIRATLLLPEPVSNEFERDRFLSIIEDDRNTRKWHVPGEISYSFATHTAAVFLTYGS